MAYTIDDELKGRGDSDRMAYTIDSEESYQKAQDELAALRAQRQQALAALPTNLGREEMQAQMDKGFANAEAELRRAYYDWIGKSYQDVPESAATDARATQLGDLRTREIDRGATEASSAIASGYSRRGIGGSGYASGSQSQAIQVAAEERGRARAAALDQAVAEGRQGLTGRASLSGKGDPFLAQMVTNANQEYQAALARAAAERRAWMDFLGSAAGAAAGSYEWGGGDGGGYTDGGTGPGVPALELIS